MNILFTRSDYVLSKLIRWVSKEPVSHCALEWQGWVIHSNLLGVHVELMSTFQEASEVLFTVAVPDSQDKVMHALSLYEGSYYDLGALLYLGLRFFLPFLPRKNLWQSTGMFLCTEWVTEVLDGEEESDITPMELYTRLAAIHR